MSLSSALDSAVSGLGAQSMALAAIAQNIANASTTAYKTKDTDFQSMVSGFDNTQTTGGVSAQYSTNMTAPGPVSSTTVPTNMAISGSGYFVVSNSPNGSPADAAYTRDGSFAPDSNGYLVNDQGYYLMAYPTDAAGNTSTANSTSASGLEPVNIADIAGSAQATSTVNMAANLPANAAIGDKFDSSMDVTDSLGVSHTIDGTWTKTGDNTWSLALANPTATGSSSTTPTGTVSPATISVTFDQNGVLASTNPSPAAVTISGLTTGAADDTFTLNMGDVGGTNGLTQNASTTTPASLENVSVTSDGARFGSLSGVSIDKNGVVTASFDNNTSRVIAKVPLATFRNPQGLNQVSGTIYDATIDSGSVTLGFAGTGSVGDITASAIEGSSTDISTEFNKMIVAQQAYSAASQVVSTTDNMFDTLMQAMR